jgi:Domain of unknown function (DUF1906)
MAQSNTNQFLGFDVATYPGDAAVAWLWTHGFRVAGFYLNHHRGGEDDTWISRRSKLINSGWGLAPLYLGWQTVDNRGNHLPAPNDPSATAAIDAAEAAKLMNKAGFDAGSVIFFDIEDGSVPLGNYDDYLNAWFSGVRTQKFSASSILFAPSYQLGVRQTSSVLVFQYPLQKWWTLRSWQPTGSP